ncbi:hypothetical protein RRG08_048816 [Elysia crispata]|uniref:Uncharacterized protein n=1 Tax=Elysia crispata TaxID=231223 RepID=A0AAE1B4N4_9GAST|nr:hypothetical protein RRG08_048816 [Elysia crispata]
MNDKKCECSCHTFKVRDTPKDMEQWIGENGRVKTHTKGHGTMDRREWSSEDENDNNKKNRHISQDEKNWLNSMMTEIWNRPYRTGKDGASKKKITRSNSKVSRYTFVTLLRQQNPI